MSFTQFLKFLYKPSVWGTSIAVCTASAVYKQRNATIKWNTENPNNVVTTGYIPAIMFGAIPPFIFSVLAVPKGLFASYKITNENGKECHRYSMSWDGVITVSTKKV